jgi:hypothetical protein
MHACNFHAEQQKALCMIELNCSEDFQVAAALTLVFQILFPFVTVNQSISFIVQTEN